MIVYIIDSEKCIFPLRRGPSLRRKIFAQEFAIDGDGRRAAIAAGYTAKSAAVAATRLLRLTVVQETIREVRSKAATEIGLRARSRLDTIRARAAVSIAEYIAFEKGAIRWKRIHELTDYQISALDLVSYNEAGEIEKLVFTDLNDALLELGRVAELTGYDNTQSLR